MLLKLIAGNAFQREVCYCLAKSPHVVDVEFTAIGETARRGEWRQSIQSRIDAADGTKRYEAILLLFGLTGSASDGLVARQTKLVMPRAHDYGAFGLGAKKRPAQTWADAAGKSSPATDNSEYVLRVDGGKHVVSDADTIEELVARYGELDAQFIWDSLHAMGDKRSNGAAGKSFDHLEESLRLIGKLVHGQWDEAEFLTVPPGGKITGAESGWETGAAGPR